MPGTIRRSEPGCNGFGGGNDELTVFRDAWIVDVAGPAGLVNDVLAALRQ